jgi:hypothetical protein
MGCCFDPSTKLAERKALPLGGRRTGSNTVLAWTRSIQTTERYLGCKQELRSAVNDRMGIEPGEYQAEDG